MQHAEKENIQMNKENEIVIIGGGHLFKKQLKLLIS